MTAQGQPPSERHTAALDTLPEFADPPVNETALSIQFAPIQELTPYLGVYWSRIRSRFSKSQVYAPLASVTEQFDKPLPRSMRPGLQFFAEPLVRHWFLDESGTRLIQVQNDRFVHNWRQVKGDEVYPRYPAIRQMLENEWSAFCVFLREENLPAPDVNQCEVTYVNHIEYGRGWNDYGELQNVISPWSGAGSGNFLPAPEQVTIESHYRLPKDLGRLHISAEPVIRGRDSKEVLQVMLTARGAPVSSAIEDIISWMDLGRRWVVEGFADFTTSSMHKLWGRQS